MCSHCCLGGRLMEAWQLIWPPTNSRGCCGNAVVRCGHLLITVTALKVNINTCLWMTCEWMNEWTTAQFQELFLSRNIDVHLNLTPFHYSPLNVKQGFTFMQTEYSWHTRVQVCVLAQCKVKGEDQWSSGIATKHGKSKITYWALWACFALWLLSILVRALIEMHSRAVDGALRLTVMCQLDYVEGAAGVEQPL